MNPRSFRTRLIFFVLMVLVPAGFLVLIANVERQLAEKDKIREQAVCAAKLAAAREDYYLRETRQLLATMTQFPFLVLLQDSGMARTGMANLKLLSPDFNDFGLVETDGTVFCHTLETDKSAGLLPAAFVRRVLANPGFAMTDVHQSEALGGPCVQFAYPVYRANKELARLMYASIKLPLLSEALAGIPLPEGGVINVIDANGNILAQRPALQSAIGKPLPAFPLIREAVAKSSDTFEMAETAEKVEKGGGTKRVCAISTIMDGAAPLLFVQVAVPRNTLFAEADARFGGSFFGMLLVGAVVLLLAWLFSERALLRPVRAMLSATERLIKGDLTARTGISTPANELHVLAKRFDVMADALARREEELKKANDEISRNNVELEDRVQKRTEELQNLNGELEAFSYSVSHDLRAPLRHIGGFAQLLASDESIEMNATARRYIGLITKAAGEMGRLIDDLLSFSKMSRQDMEVQMVDSTELVKSVVDEITSAEPERQITWDIRSLPPVQGDAAMLRQVWRNLISNAVKYTRGKDSAKIEIFSFSDREEIVFVIGDNGVGFNMAYAERLFGVFQRLHRQDEFEGTGIGLANVRRIINRHGGRTWAEAEMGKGARFFFSFPKK
jgi:signal transduction histidine kinase